MPFRRVACAQLEARDLHDALRSLDDAVAMVLAAGDAGADLCILPEGTYPAYVLGSAAAARDVLAAGPDPSAVLGDAARRAGLEVVAGLVVDTPAGLLNAAVHLGADGRERARVGKRFLWDFDREWFVPGGDPAVAGGVGMLVCADARLPEIPRGLVRGGATLLVNSTAWVTPVPPPEGTNPQAEFLWRVRALEAGVPAAAATKVGSEAGMAIYSGCSQIVDARGEVVAMAGPVGPELLVADVEVPERPHPPFDDTDEAMGEPVRPESRDGHVYVVALSHGDLGDVVSTRDAHVVVAPGRSLTTRDLPGSSVATVAGDAMLVAGPARRAARQGAVVLVWWAEEVSSPFVETVARARAFENRVFVVVWRNPSDGGPFVVSPAGRVIARAPAPGARHAVAASCLWADAANKEMAPGTDVWDGVVALGAARRA